MSERLCLAVDIGGTKLAAGLVRQDGELLTSRSLPTPPGADSDGLFSALAGLVNSVKLEAPQGAVSVCGVGCGGPMRPGGERVSPLNIPAWRDFPLRDRLGEACGLPTYVDNDAKALALAEGWRGAATGRRNYIAMVVSTGIGGGVVSDGQLLDGETGNAGHIGHVIVEPGGRLCTCGSRGCLEAEASGTAVQRTTGRSPSEADPATIEYCGTMVGRAVASVATLLDLELAVVAGSVALGYGEPFFATAQAELSARARIEFAARARIVPAGLGASGPLIGAGAVGWRGAG